MWRGMLWAARGAPTRFAWGGARAFRPEVAADLAHHVHHRRRAPAAPPAVDQRAPTPRAIEERPLDVAGDVARGERGADALRVERRLALEDRSHLGALGVVE